MGGRKKKFIDKKKSATFQLISRDTSDPLYTEDPSNDRVFVRVDNNSESPFFDDVNSDGDGIFDDAPDEEEYSGGPSRSLPGGSNLPDEVRREIVELGFPDDGYNYLSHLREIKAASDFYRNPKATFEQLPSDVKAYDASRIEVSKANDEESYKNKIYGVAVKTVPVRIQKAIDPEVAALLDDSDNSRFGSDVEDLEEDFVLNANLPDESEDLDLDRMPTLAEHSNVNNNEEKYNTYYSQDNINEGGNRNIVGAKPRERRPLDEQFDMLELQEYGTDSEDEYEKATSEDYEYHDSHAVQLNDTALEDAIKTIEMDGYKVISHDKNIEEEPISLETAADLRPRCIQYAEQFENENDNDKEDVFLEESSDESEGWDCETIITTYSNLDNHPGKIEAPGGKRKKKLTETVNKAFTAPTHVIALKGREKLPVDFLPHSRTSGTELVKDNSKPKDVQQPKKKVGAESKEEKKERKAAVKEEKREARRAKKDLKELYKCESQQAQKVAAFTGPSSIHLM
ncbi:protein LTV1 [Tanacetum coccineum]